MNQELLPNEVVVEIRMLRYAAGCELSAIADHLALNYRDNQGKPLSLPLPTISRICSGATYAGVGGPRTTAARAKKMKRERTLYGAAA